MNATYRHVWKLINAHATMQYHVPFAMHDHIYPVITQKVWLIYIYIYYNAFVNAKCILVLRFTIFLLRSYLAI